MKSLAVVLLALGLSSPHAMSQPLSAEETWSTPAAISGLKKCLWGETIGKADGIRRATAMGFNIEAALAAHCEAGNGAGFMCERSGETIEFCSAKILEYVRAAVDEEMTRAGYEVGSR